MWKKLTDGSNCVPKLSRPCLKFRRSGHGGGHRLGDRGRETGSHLEVIWMSFGGNWEGGSISFGSYLGKIGKPSGGHLEFIWRPLVSNPGVIWKSFGGRLEVIWRSFGSHLEVISKSSGGHLEVVCGETGSHLELI